MVLVLIKRAAIGAAALAVMLAAPAAADWSHNIAPDNQGTPSRYEAGTKGFFHPVDDRLSAWQQPPSHVDAPGNLEALVPTPATRLAGAPSADANSPIGKVTFSRPGTLFTLTGSTYGGVSGPPPTSIDKQSLSDPIPSPAAASLGLLGCGLLALARRRIG